MSDHEGIFVPNALFVQVKLIFFLKPDQNEFSHQNRVEFELDKCTQIHIYLIFMSKFKLPIVAKRQVVCIQEERKKNNERRVGVQSLDCSFH